MKSDPPAELVAEFEQLLAELAPFNERAKSFQTQMRTAAYRMAQFVREARENHFEWLREQADKSGGFEAMYESWFGPAMLVGHNWGQLLANVEQGMTEAEYLAQGDGWGGGLTSLRKRKSKSAPRKPTDEAAEGEPSGAG